MIKIQTPIVTATQLFPTFDSQDIPTAPTFTELLEQPNTSLNPPEVTWDRLIALAATELALIDANLRDRCTPRPEGQANSPT